MAGFTFPPTQSPGESPPPPPPPTVFEFEIATLAADGSGFAGDQVQLLLSQVVSLRRTRSTWGTTWAA